MSTTAVLASENETLRLENTQLRAEIEQPQRQIQEPPIPIATPQAQISARLTLYANELLDSNSNLFPDYDERKRPKYLRSLKRRLLDELKWELRIRHITNVAEEDAKRALDWIDERRKQQSSEINQTITVT